MMDIKFKSLEPSEMIRNAVIERMQGVVDKFPDLELSKIGVTIEMENSQHKPGPDVFAVRVFIDGKKYKSIKLEKSDANVYVALAEVVDHLLERLNRYGDKVRVKNRNQLRKLAEIVEVS